MKTQYRSGRYIWYELLGNYGEAKAKETLQYLIDGLSCESNGEYKSRIHEALKESHRWEHKRGIRIIKDIEGRFGRFAFTEALYRDVLEEEYGKEAIQGLITCRLAEPCGSLNGRKLIALKEIEGI